MKALLRVFVVLLLVLPALSCRAQSVPDAEGQIAGAVLPAPEHQRADATVYGYDADGALVTLREGSNDLICLADQPGDDRFHTACYHASLEPYMARGRALRAEGVERQESFDIRHAEAEAGTLVMPTHPAAVYNISAPLAEFDPARARVTLYALYMPYATQANTGMRLVMMTLVSKWFVLGRGRAIGLASLGGSLSAVVMVLFTRDLRYSYFG